jgi:hypothetical protein
MSSQGPSVAADERLENIPAKLRVLRARAIIGCPLFGRDESEGS